MGVDVMRDQRLKRRVLTPPLHWVARVKQIVRLILVVTTPAEGGSRSGQTRKKPRDLSAYDREERGRGEGGVMYAVCMR